MLPNKMSYGQESEDQDSFEAPPATYPLYVPQLNNQIKLSCISKTTSQHLCRVLAINIPADPPGRTFVERSSGSDCIFPGCWFLIEDMDVYRVHLMDEHAIVFTETCKSHVHHAVEEESALEEEGATEAGSVDELEDVLHSSRLSSTPSRRSSTSLSRSVTPSRRGSTPSFRGTTPSFRGSTPSRRGSTSSTSSESNINELLQRFDAAFEQMVQHEKWVLSTGKVVEDELYKFGKKCNYEHDGNYITQGHFSREELKEIESYKAVNIPNIPEHVEAYLNSLEGNELPENKPANFETNCDYRGLEHSTERLILTQTGSLVPCMQCMWINEYEAGHLEAPHSEQWYQMRIWSMIDKLFDNVPGLETVRGEAASRSTSLRKNEDRVIASVSPMSRKVMGRRGDLLLLKGKAEYGCAEAGSKYDGPKASKKMIESGLIENTQNVEKHAQQSCKFVSEGGRSSHQSTNSRKYCRLTRQFALELVMEILIMDVPQEYVARLTKSIEYMVPQQISNVSTELLPLLSVLISIKVIDIVENRVPATEHPRNRFANTFVRQGTPENVGQKRKFLPPCSSTPEKRR
ncbi:hypothetical protein NQZ79_g7965 [Umbelopsis isabellina]|nr:hypothetical protein NQZ79_g7965 [Umbelopsis isabellina]